MAQALLSHTGMSLQASQASNRISPHQRALEAFDALALGSKNGTVSRGALTRTLKSLEGDEAELLRRHLDLHGDAFIAALTERASIEAPASNEASQRADQMSGPPSSRGGATGLDAQSLHRRVPVSSSKVQSRGPFDGIEKGFSFSWLQSMPRLSIDPIPQEPSLRLSLGPLLTRDTKHVQLDFMRPQYGGLEAHVTPLTVDADSQWVPAGPSQPLSMAEAKALMPYVLESNRAMSRMHESNPRPKMRYAAQSQSRMEHAFLNDLLRQVAEGPVLPKGIRAAHIHAANKSTLSAIEDYHPALERAYPGQGEIEDAQTLAAYVARTDIDWQILRYEDSKGEPKAGVHLNVFTTPDGRKMAAFEQAWADQNLSPKEARALFAHAVAEARAKGAEGIVVEMNDPKVWGPADQDRTPYRADNMEFMGQLGFQRVEGRYVQPVLNPGDPPVEGLHLGYLSLTDRDATSLSKAQVSDALAGYHGSFDIFTAQGGVEAARADPHHRAFVQSLADDVALRPM